MNRQVAEELVVEYTSLAKEEAEDAIDSIFLSSDHLWQEDLMKGKERDEKVVNAIKGAVKRKMDSDKLLSCLDKLFDLYYQMNDNEKQYWFLVGLRIGSVMHHYR